MIPRLNVGGFLNNSSVVFPGFIWPDINPVNYTVEIDLGFRSILMRYREWIKGKNNVQ
jgi:hypothetical protein